MHQSGNPEVLGSSLAGGERFAVGRTFSGQSYKRIVPLAMHFIPPRRLNWVPGNLWIVYLSDCPVAPNKAAL